MSSQREYRAQLTKNSPKTVVSRKTKRITATETLKGPKCLKDRQAATNREIALEVSLPALLPDPDDFLIVISVTLFQLEIEILAEG